MANLSDAKKNLIEKIDDLFWFNIQNRTDWISYDFGQYRLNKLYKPLVKYFIEQFMNSLEEYSEQDAKKIIWYFTDFFSLYYNNWDFWYFKNRFSSYEYRIPYSWADTEFWWATKDCFYVKTSDVVNNMNVNIWWLFEGDKQIQLKMFKRTEPKEDDNWNVKYEFDIRIEDIYDDEDELLWYSLIFINTEESKTNSSSTIFKNKIKELFKDKWIDYDKTPSLQKEIENFIKKWWRDYFIHKRLKSFLIEELEWYFFQMLKNDIQWKADVLEMQKKIEEFKIKYADEPDVLDFKIDKLKKELNADINKNIYKEAYLWIYNYINILSDLEEFKAKLWTKKRKVIKQDYCISLWKIKELVNVLSTRDKLIDDIFNNEKQVKEWKNLWMSDNPSKEDNSLVVDTKNFEWENRNKLIDIVNDDRVIWRLYNSDNYQALDYIKNINIWWFDCIYIDPPYNTWNDGFVYKDWYNKASWYSMMEWRLKLANSMMNENSLIFISIDDKEQAWLEKLCDIIFGKNNFVWCFIRNISDWNNIWQISVTHEYFLCYKNGNMPYLNILSDKWELIDTRLTNNWNTKSILKFPKWLKFVNEEDKVFSWIIWWNSEPIKIIWKMIFEGWILKEDVELEAEWRMPWVLQKLFAWEQVYDKKWQEYTLPYFTSTWVPHTYKIRNWWIFRSVQIWNNATSEVDNILWKTKQFSNPKPLTMIKDIVRLCWIQNVLDFFAWSWTTWHAVMKLNKEDWWFRKFIEVELWKYFDDVTLLRTKKIQYSQNWKDWKAVNNDWTQWIIEYTKLNQYEDWFNEWWYLDSIQWEIQQLSDLNIDKIWDIKEILYPLNELKDRIYHLDDELIK